MSPVKRSTMNNYCFVCRQPVPDDQAYYDGRFSLAFCDKHKNVPPAYADEAIRQWNEDGKTRWDVID
jgi:hypothetical protein